MLPEVPMEPVKDVTQLTDAALEIHIERCERLIQHPGLLTRLPDRGNDIRRRHSDYITERLRRSQLNSSSMTSDAVAENGKKSEHENGNAAGCNNAICEVLPGGEASHSSTLTEKEDAKEVSEERENFEAAARAIGEKYRHQRVPVEEIVRRTFGGSLSEGEIDRILQDVPPGFFLTHHETVAMQRNLAMEERTQELERLRVQEK